MKLDRWRVGRCSQQFWWGPSGNGHSRLRQEIKEGNRAARVEECDEGSRRRSLGSRKGGPPLHAKDYRRKHAGGTENHFQEQVVIAPRLPHIDIRGPSVTSPRDSLSDAAKRENGDPSGQSSSLTAAVRSGLYRQSDVAPPKCCYADINRSIAVSTLFRIYQATLGRWEQDFPPTGFLHPAVRVTVASLGLKGTTKALHSQDDNMRRKCCSRSMGHQYFPDSPFDTASIEGSAANGTRKPASYPGYATNGGGTGLVWKCLGCGILHWHVGHARDT